MWSGGCRRPPSGSGALTDRYSTPAPGPVPGPRGADLPEAGAALATAGLRLPRSGILPEYTSETLLITARNRPTSTGTARSAALADRRDLLQVYPESGNPASDGGSSRCTSSDHEPPSPERIRGIVGGLSGANRVVVAPGSLIPAESGEEHPSREHTTTSKSYEKGPQPDRARVGDLYRKYVEGSP